MITKDLREALLIPLLRTKSPIGKARPKVRLNTLKTETNMNKNGWGAAKLGKVHKESQDSYGEYKQSNVKSSKDLNGLYSKYQGKKK